MTRLYLAVEGVEHFDWRRDPSILISEDDICKSEWEEFFVGGKPHFYCKKEQFAWYREDEYKFVTIEQVTDAGLLLFGGWTREEVAEEAAARAEERAKKEAERQKKAEETRKKEAKNRERKIKTEKARIEKLRKLINEVMPLPDVSKLLGGLYEGTEAKE